MSARVFALLALLCACSSNPIPIEPEPVDAGAGGSGAACTVYEPYAGTGKECDPTLNALDCPASENPCMPAFCTNDGVCVLADPGEGQPGMCGPDLWCVYVSAGNELGCCVEAPACIYDASNNCVVSGPSSCPASHPWCSRDGMCCQ